MLATLSSEMPKGKAWVYEEKYDGIRTVSARRERSVRLWSRTLKDLTADFASVTRALDELRAPDVILDGEVVVFDREGVSRFQLLQRRGTGGTLAYAIFDVLELDGRPLLKMPLRDRRALLEEIVPARRGVLMRSRRLGKEPLGEARARGWEGIIAKDETSPYEPGKRTRSWLKIKVRKEAEFVIGGFTPPEGSRAAFGSLVLGMYEGDRFRYVGRVGTGFTGDTLKMLAAKMRPLVTPASPFDPPPKGVKDPTWVRPYLVAQIAYAEWTSDGRLRQPSFLGLRADKPAREVRWEEREP